MPRGGPGPDLIQTWPRPDPDPAVDCLPTTVDRWSGGGQRWSSGSQRWWRLDELKDDTSSWYCSSIRKISMSFLVISKFPSILRIKRKPHSPAHMERLLIAACLLGYAMLQARFIAQRSESSSSITSSFDTEIAALKAEMAEINKNLMKPPLAILKTFMLREPIKANDTILKNMQTNMTSLTNSNLELKNMFGQFMKMNTASSSGLGTLSGNTVTILKEDLKVVERETEASKDMMHPTNNGSTKDVQPLVVQSESPILNSEPVNFQINKPVASLVSAPRPNQRPSILYPSRLQDQKLHDKANDQREKFFQIFKDLNFNISFADALTLMPKYFLKTGRALIDVFKEYSREVLGFSDVITSGNPTPYYDLIVSTTSPTLTPFEKSDFLLEEVDAFLTLEDDHTSPEVDQSYLDYEGDIILLEAFLNDDLSLSHPNQGNYLPEVRKELKICEAKFDKSSIDEPPEVKLKDLPPHLEYAFLEGDDKLPFIIAKDLSIEEKTALITVLKSHNFWDSFQSCLSHLEKMLKRCEDTNLCLNWENSHFMVKEGILLGHKISKEGIDVDKAKVYVITKLPHPTTVKGIRSFLGHVGFYRRKLTEAPILIAPDWDMPFELMCDASDFAIGAVLRQRQEKHFRPINYASKTMTKAESNYTTKKGNFSRGLCL
nr:retrovirus-related Pol polyprotein from transposon 17.6 [Tanacetum cinerariifolium]